MKPETAIKNNGGFIMRKVFLGALAVIVLSTGTISAFAAGPGTGRYYVDENGDGICDNWDTHSGCIQAGIQCGSYYVDADNDGICDHYASGQSRGRGHGHGFRCGHSR